MHHQRSRSGRDLDEAVFKLESAREALLDANVKTGEAISRAAVSLWKRECRRSPDRVHSAGSLRNIVITSSPSSPKEESAPTEPHVQRNRSIGLHAQAQILHQCVTFSPKFKKIEVKNRHILENELTSAESNHNIEELTSQPPIRRRGRRPHAPSSSIPVVSMDSLGRMLADPLLNSTGSTPLSEADELVVLQHQQQPTLAPLRTRTETLTSIADLLDTLQSRLHHVPSAQTRPAASVGHVSDSGELCCSTSAPSGGDLRTLDMHTREVLAMLAQRYSPDPMQKTRSQRSSVRRPVERASAITCDR